MTIGGGTVGPAVHVVDPGVPLETLVVDPLDVWRTQPSVRKVVDFAASNLASIPIHAYQRGTDGSRTRVRDGRLGSLLRRPAPFTTPHRFWHSLHVDGMLWDKWCFVVLYATATEPEMMYRLPPTRFRILKDEYGIPAKIVVWGKDSQEYHLDPAMAVFDSGYCSAWGDPVPPVEAIADLLNEASESRKYRRELLRNGARIENVIERPKEAGEWSDTAWNRFKSQFNSYKAGGGEAGGTPILEDGMVLKKVEAFSPQSLETLQARTLTDVEVSSFYHIPPELVGAREGTFSNLDAFRQMLFSVALGPRITAWEQTLDVMLGPILELTDDYYLEAHVEAKLRGSFLEQTQQLQSAIGAPYMTRNEGRGRLNMEKVDGGDELITPLNVVTGGLASPRDTAPKKAEEFTLGKAQGRA